VSCSTPKSARVRFIQKPSTLRVNALAASLSRFCATTHGQPRDTQTHTRPIDTHTRHHPYKRRKSVRGHQPTTHAPRTSPTSEARISEVLSLMARADGTYSSFLSPKQETGRAGTWRSALGRTRAPPSHHRLGVDAPSVHHARCRTAQATPVDLAAHAQDMPSRAERERGGSAPVPAVRGARAVPAPLRRARAAPAPIWRARARPIAPIVHFREVAEARVLVLVGGTTATATALAPVRVVHGAAHDLRYRAAAPGRAAFEARALAREHVGAALGARPVALSRWRAAALAAAVPTAAAAAVPTCVNVRAVWVCSYGS